jgi:hypothetical protein
MQALELAQQSVQQPVQQQSVQQAVQQVGSMVASFHPNMCSSTVCVCRVRLIDT